MERILTEGETIKDTYEVEKFLGEGAFAEVYRVKHRFLGRQAMKVFKQVGMTMEEISKMLGEAILLSKVGHPNIVRVFDANVIETTKGFQGYFTMENVTGGSLEKFWQGHGMQSIPVETTVELAKQICLGLSVAHGQNPPIIHRDIKPQNILVGYEENGLRARISDFGLAKSVNPLTLLATVAGTPTFKPPEVFKKHKSDSCSADTWAVGTTLYLLLTNMLPFKTPNEYGWGDTSHLEKELLPPSSINPDTNKVLDDIVKKALKVNPSERYQNATELLEALNKWDPDDREPTTYQAREKTEITPLSGVSNAEEAIAVALEYKNEGKLTEAAEFLESKFNDFPELREKYRNAVKLWRCGISM
jgi:eukaryotic-like serine/threonine-protein kinase